MKIQFLSLRMLLIAACTTTGPGALLCTPAQASDHVDGPITIADAVADISDLYAFPSPNNAGRLVLVMDVYPFVHREGHFSDRITYSLMVRPTTLSGNGIRSTIRAGNREFRFDCNFETPHGKTHWATCTTPSGPPIRVRVNDVIGTESAGARIFAGHRADPFLFNSTWFASVVKDGIIPPANASNNMRHLNVLSIIIELDVTQVFGHDAGALFAVAAETTTRDSSDGALRRIDRVGRPEISNAHLVAHGRPDLRNRYNQEDTFNVSPEGYALYKTRLRNNIEFYDGLDGHKDWDDQSAEALTRLLLNDYLVVDISKPFMVKSYFEIERSMLRSQPYKWPGGRVPGDNVINTLFSTLVNDGRGQEVTNGIPTGGMAQDEFPYLGNPNKGIISTIITHFARRSAAKLAENKSIECREFGSASPGAIDNQELQFHEQAVGDDDPRTSRSQEFGDCGQ